MRNRYVKWICLIILGFYSMCADAQSPAVSLEAQNLLTQLRCLSCQTESIADSRSAFAEELRMWIFAALNKGESVAQIKAELVRRYGEQILLRPPLRNTTFLLWFFPFLSLLLSSGFIFYRLRIKQKARQDLNEKEREQLRKILGDF